jgi:hypothetical protein
MASVNLFSCTLLPRHFPERKVVNRIGEKKTEAGWKLGGTLNDITGLAR